ncbi:MULTISPECIES: hypothetical protein [unclassified Streptomyces]|uniref:hypothetical protein n=1 Tax=unclassified Streptomyces TaxID=2593676 RepID=UPI002E341F86|nr:hypothetical protein [Streptomyces sp. NBC_01268]
MRKWVTVAVTAGLFMGGIGAAVADSWQEIKTRTTDGSKFRDAKYRWEPKDGNHGGFHFKGDLVDSFPNDGHNVYLQAKVQGYAWNRFNGVQRKTVHLDREVYDGAALYSTDASIRVCRDRGSLRPDNCSPELSYHRKG